MKEWSDYSKSHEQAIKTTGKIPSVRGYFLIKLIDGMPFIVLFLLTGIFVFLAFFVVDNQDPNKLNWALHATELCLGVLLGLYAGKKV